MITKNLPDTEKREEEKGWKKKKNLYTKGFHRDVW